MRASDLPSLLLPVAQTMGIVLSLALSAWAAWKQHRSQQVDILIQITQSHRAIWDEMFRRPELRRVADPNASATDPPISSEERLFVVLLALHLGAVYEAQRTRAIRPIWGLDRDIESFFSAPIPRRVWQDLREFQDPAFRNFVDERLRVSPPPVFG